MRLSRERIGAPENMDVDGARRAIGPGPRPDLRRSSAAGFAVRCRQNFGQIKSELRSNAVRFCSGETQLFVKELTVGGARYIVCRNEAEAEKDRADRQAIVANLEKRLSGGDKALIGNAGYRRYLRRTGAGKAFEIDAGKLAEEARFDGIFVLRTNARMTPLNAVLRYRELLLVEDLFRRAKVQLRTRPIYHSCDAAIRGHVFCSFLALVLQKELADLCRSADVTVEWDDLIRDLDRLQEATIEKDGKRVTTRTYVEGQLGRVFQAAGVALPSNWREHPA